MSRQPTDTDPRIEKILIAGYRAMDPATKLERVAALNRALDDLGRARLRATYGADLSPREEELRLPALRLDRQTLIEATGWDPDEQGY